MIMNTFIRFSLTTIAILFLTSCSDSLSNSDTTSNNDTTTTIQITTTPDNNSQSIEIDLESIQINSNLSIDPTSILTNNVSITPPVNFHFDLSLLSSNNQITVVLDESFSPDTTYTVSAAGLRQSDGSPLETIQFSFTTESQTAPPPSPGIVKAFPSAEGFGANATGGRGGQVIKVTNLNSTGDGSFQAALNVNAPRIIIFEVSGVIEGDINIPYGNVTIAGQTAPGGGITIHGRLECDYSNGPDNMIIRHIRVRADHSANPSVAGNQYDGIQCSRSSNLIFDHISVSGGVDENFDLYSATDLTVQWSTITRSDPDGGHYEAGHNYGLINGPNGRNISIHHNLFAHHRNRSPAIANGPAEIINNIAYNVRHGFIHHNPATGNFNIIGNYFKQGPNDNLIPFFFDDENSGSGNPALSYYLQDNYIDDPDDYVGIVNNPWKTPLVHSSFSGIDWGWDSSIARTTQEHTFTSVPVTTSSSLSNYDLVLNQAGAFPRDIMTAENIQEVRDRSGGWGARIPSDLMQGLTTSSAPTDTDNDGIPDTWESSHSLSTTQADHNTVMQSGYTAIEEYINEVADQLIP